MVVVVATWMEQRSTVRLVSRVPSFFCGDRTIEINTSLESAWSTKLISVGIIVNRGRLDEVEQVIDCADSGANRFLLPVRFLVNSSIVPSNVAISSQKRNGAPCSEPNQICPGSAQDHR